MARGKHSLQASRQRTDAAHEHIDRLTDEVVKWKMLAKQHESEAAAAPGLRKLVHELSVKLEQQSSPLLDAERASHRKSRDGYEDRLAQVARIVRAAIDRVEPDGVDAKFSTADIASFDELLGEPFRGESDMPRHLRRFKMTRGAISKAVEQMSDKELRDNGLMRVGNKVALVDPSSNPYYKACVNPQKMVNLSP